MLRNSTISSQAGGSRIGGALALRFLRHPDNLLDHKAATVRMVEETLKFAAISDEESKRPRRVVDVGCGMGGSSRYLTKKYGAHVEGITLSTWQVQRATARTAAECLSDKLEAGFFVEDEEAEFLLADEEADLFMENDKAEAWRIWDRDLSKGETSLQPSEQEFLDKISRTCCLLAWWSTTDYVRMAQTLSLQIAFITSVIDCILLQHNIKTADWSQNVALFWSSAVNKVSPILLESGLKAMKGVSPLSLWVDGFQQELIKYAIITAQKPA